MNRLIADSGSTKTDWALAGEGEALFITTSGLNPVTLGEERFAAIISSELLPQLRPYNIDKVEFYGAGCRPSLIPMVERVLKNLLNVDDVFVASDMLGAAKAACGNGEGIAAILGTGANSCLYDGHGIVANTPALGYILGDEGGGAVLGKHFLNAIFKGGFPAELRDDFLLVHGLNLEMIIERVYRGQAPNRFLASFSPYINKAKVKYPKLRTLIVDNMRSFLVKNIRPYGRPDLPVNVVGSMGYYYEEELREAAEIEGFTIGRIVKSPIEGLMKE